MVDNDLSFRSYADLQGLDNLKARSRKNDPKALEAVAKQFESLFLNMLLKNMRKANETFSEGGYFDSNQSRFYQGMLDQQLALTLSENNGIGLSDVMVRQLSPKTGAVAAAGEDRLEREVFRQAMERTTQAAVEAAAKRSSEVSDLPELQPGDFADAIKRVEAELIGQPVPVEQVLAQLKSEASSQTGGATLEPDFSTPESFVQTLYPSARAVAGELGVDPRVLVAQAALETGWGKHLPTHADGSSSYNLFGIKADGRWQGDSTLVNTLEYRQGVAVQEKAAFRAYGSYQESMRDYVDFIRSHPRYQSALEQATDGEAYLQQLQSAGYATDPEYARKIAGIMNGSVLQNALNNS